MAEDKESGKKDSSVSREERMARIQNLIRERGEDAAKMVKTWLQQTQERRK